MTKLWLEFIMETIMKANKPDSERQQTAYVIAYIKSIFCIAIPGVDTTELNIKRVDRDEHLVVINRRDSTNRYESWGFHVPHGYVGHAQV